MAIVQEERGRIFQDDHFVFDELNGLAVQQITICKNKMTKELIIVYLKVINQDWYRYFLDLGYGFWESHRELDWDDDGWGEDDFEFIDYTEKLGLAGKIINKIYCQPQGNNCQIIIEFDAIQLVLQTVESEIYDSASELVLRPIIDH